MGLFDKFFGSDKVKVHFVDSVTGKTIGVAEMPPEQLPETFSKPTTMHIHDNEWSVDEATPPNAVDFISTKKLTLKLRKIEKVKTEDILFTLPTISNELPQQADTFMYNDFETAMHEDDWRQREFLKPAALPLIDIEITGIKEVWANASKKIEDSFTAFTKCHVRSTIGEPGLTIDLNALKEFLDVTKVGSLKINDSYVERGFSLRTDSTIYYGTLADSKVTQLGIYSWSNSSVPELVRLTRQFDLVFVNWYDGDVLRGDN
ncbi:MAG TPA: hypothetical protein VIN08_07040 [Ohtaekwangia sp.]|uniref:hypothetical protein n=1 Tax=Ohtaekwangia sp. TaxID=2066019 RepID=UPI002F933753